MSEPPDFGDSLLRKAKCSPSGCQIGLLSERLPGSDLVWVSILRLEPSAPITQMAQDGSEATTKAIFVPSGDQDGYSEYSAVEDVLVSWLRLEPSGSTV
jgi:hypothetical protein